MYCGECKKECEAEWVDFGIGPFEFWGAKCCDTQWGYASTCCEGTVYEDEDCKVEVTPPAGDDEY